jgi:hypothetical protein
MGGSEHDLFRADVAVVMHEALSDAGCSPELAGTICHGIDSVVLRISDMRSVGLMKGTGGLSSSTHRCSGNSCPVLTGKLPRYKSSPTVRYTLVKATAVSFSYK